MITNESAMTQITQFTDLPGTTAHRFDGHQRGASVSVFISHNPPGNGTDLHRHPYDETFIVQDGEATFTIADETIVVRGGEIVVVPAGVPHKFINSGNQPLQKISIHPVPTMQTEWLN